MALSNHPNLLGRASASTSATAVTSAAVIADNAVVRGDGGGRGIQGSLASIDDSGNLNVNNTNQGYTTTATAAGTTTLTVGSTFLQYFTGSTTQTVVLPVTSTLVLGQRFMVVNNSSGAVTVNSSGSNLVASVPASSSVVVTCILTSGTSEASWNAAASSGSVGVTSITGTANQITASAATGAITLSIPAVAQIATSLAIGGATIGSNALAVTGTAAFSSTVAIGAAQNLSQAGFYTSSAITGLQFKSATTNARTLLGVVPNGNSRNSDVWVFNTSDAITNFEAFTFGYSSNDNNWAITSLKGGTGTVRPIIIDATGSSGSSTANVVANIDGTTTIRLLLTASSGITIAGTNTLKLGVTAAATIGVSADTTAGVLTFTAPSAGSILFTSPLSIFSGGVGGTPQALSGAGAVNVTTLTTALTSTGGSQALTLADGTNGQLKTIVHDVDGGSSILTPTTKTGFSTVTFSNAGDTATLQFFTTRGWMVLASFGAVVA